MRHSQFIKALEKSQKSNPIKSTRRILFNHLDQTIEERGHFHVDQMYGSGSGILLKIDYKFYILTADHVIRNATQYNFSNESPFWITSKSNVFPTEMLEFLMPAWIIHIGEEIENSDIKVDLQDLVLIELFTPPLPFMPDHFLDLNHRNGIFLRKDQFFEGQVLSAAGYPFHSNSFDFHDEAIGQFTHSTTVHRFIYSGLCKLENGIPHITLHDIPKEYPDLNGMSGGIICNVQPKANLVKMAGMILTAGKKTIRFIPSYIIESAIKNRENARRTLVDPAATRENPTEEDLKTIKRIHEFLMKNKY